MCARCGRADEDINLLWDVFVLDRDTGTMTRLSGDPQGCWFEASTGPAIDGAALTVVFSSLHQADDEDQGVDGDLFIRRSIDAASLARSR